MKTHLLWGAVVLITVALGIVTNIITVQRGQRATDTWQARADRCEHWVNWQFISGPYGESDDFLPAPTSSYPTMLYNTDSKRFFVGKTDTTGWNEVKSGLGLAGAPESNLITTSHGRSK